MSVREQPHIFDFGTIQGSDVIPPRLETVYYSLLINGEDISNYIKGCIGSFDFEELSSGISSLTLTFADPEYAIVDARILYEDMPIEFEAGLTNGVRFDPLLTFKGYLSIPRISFPAGGIPTVVFACVDESHKLNRLYRNRTWDNMTPSNIARRIFDKYGMAYSVDEGTIQTKTTKSTDTTAQEEQKNSIPQSGQTDIQFLLSLAEQMEGGGTWRVFVKDNAGYFKKPLSMTATSKITLEYKTGEANLFSFEPTIKREEIKTEIMQEDIDGQTQKPNKETANEPVTPQGNNKIIFDKTGNTWDVIK